MLATHTLRTLAICLPLAAMGCTATNNTPVRADAAGADAASADAASVDAVPAIACPTSTTHMCVAPAPDSSWSGPVTRSVADAPAVPLACGVKYSEEVMTAHEGLIADGSCSCECSSPPVGTTCTPAVLQGHQPPPTGFAPCARPAGTAKELFAPSCQRLLLAFSSQISHIQVSMGQVADGGSCNEDAPVVDALEAPTWSSSGRYCAAGAPLEAVCEGDDLCAYKPDSGFGEQLCIYKAGVHSCGESETYTEFFQRYTAVSDERQCDECSCEPPAQGSACPGSVAIGAGNCTDEVTTTNSCIANPWDTTTPINTQMTVNPDVCQGISQLSGEATPTDLVTICCQSLDE